MTNDAEREQIMTQTNNDMREFEHNLKQLAQSFSLDADFDAALKAQFRDEPTQRKQLVVLKPMARTLLTAAASLTLAALLVVSVPSLRTIAQDLLSQLFPTTDDTEITITYNDDLGTPQEFETLAAMQEAVPFSVVEAGNLPRGSVDTSYVYYPGRNVATQIYSTMRRNFTVSQQPIADAQANGLLAFSFDLALPADAIQPVQLGDTQAELVRGMWVESGTTDADGEPRYRWSNTFWHFALRWQDDTYLYEVALMPSGGNISEDASEADLIAVAEHMQQ
jgi:hypothetical protein